MTDYTYLDAFKQHLQEQDRAPLTIQGYLQDLRVFAAWFEATNHETMTPHGITPTDLNRFRQHMLLVERHKASTVNRRLASLSAYLSWAQTQSYITHNPAEHVRGVRQIPAGPRYLTRKEQYALLRALEKDLAEAKRRYPRRWRGRQRDVSLVLLLLNTGLRLQEMLNLQKEDVTLSARKGQVLVRQGKGSKQRSVPLNKEARQALEAWLAVRPVQPHSYLWAAVEAATEKPLSSRSVQRALKRYAHAAQLTELSPHVLRHTFAKNLVDAGVGLEKVAALLGHASLNTTRMYITPSQIDLAHAVDVLDELY